MMSDRVFYFNHTDLCVPLDGLISSLYVCVKGKETGIPFGRVTILLNVLLAQGRCSRQKSAEVHLKTCIAARNETHIYFGSYSNH